MPVFEHVPEQEQAQIDSIVRLSREQMSKRFGADTPARRGQHAKDHGCVAARFRVMADLPAPLRVGVFASAGHEYAAYVRFSNAEAEVTEDSKTENGVTTHRSRGMAIKLMGVTGEPLLPLHGALTQDFLMVNHPVFPFANVEDYEAVTRVITADGAPQRFFRERIQRKADGSPDTSDAMTQRTLRTAGVVKRIQSASLSGTPPAYQAPPASPLDNRYFSGAPFTFGSDAVMKFRASPAAPVAGDGNIAERDYLRKALHSRLTAPGAAAVVFEFQVQVRAASSVNVDTEIEDATNEWKESEHPFVTVAQVTIAPQDFEQPAMRALCEELVFTPWHGITAHRPLGGINRLRKAVYESSAAFRHIPKEPAGF
jgi:hypothetical protein